MPRIGVYRSLLPLIGIYWNLLDPFDRKELIFSFFPIRFHIVLLQKMATLKSVKGFCSHADFHWKCCIVARRCEIKVTRKKVTGYLMNKCRLFTQKATKVGTTFHIIALAVGCGPEDGMIHTKTNCETRQTWKQKTVRDVHLHKGFNEFLKSRWLYVELFNVTTPIRKCLDILHARLSWVADGCEHPLLIPQADIQVKRINDGYAIPVRRLDEYTIKLTRCEILNSRTRANIGRILLHPFERSLGLGGAPMLVEIPYSGWLGCRHFIECKIRGYRQRIESSLKVV